MFDSKMKEPERLDKAIDRISTKYGPAAIETGEAFCLEAAQQNSGH
jgi:hypothetical protein